MQQKSILVGLMIVVLTIFGLTGCSKDSSNPYSPPSSSPPPPQGQSNTVSMYNMAFTPATLTVAVNTTVTWTNNDGVAHTSTSDTGVWDTGSIPAGGSKTTTFATVGTFPYHCSVHPMMTGKIVVQ
jgi:plastocyanin